MGESVQVTLKDVASAVGVSTMTVSLALRNHPRITAPRRALIHDVAERMGYRPNAMASALVYQRKNSSVHPISAELAWINHWEDSRRLRSYKEFELYWRGAMRAAEKFGFRLEEFLVDRKLTLSRLEKILQSRNIQGILIPPHGSEAVTSLDIRSFDWSRYSVVRFGYSVPDVPAHVVASNQIQGTMLAFSKITDRGYQRIGYVCHRCSSTHSKAGFLMAQTKLLSNRRLPLLEMDAHAADCLEKLSDWLEVNKPDAILTEMAELPAMLCSLGHRVPDEIGVAATSVLDGNADAGIYQNSEEVGRVAIETLIGLVYQNQTGIPKLCRETLVDCVWRDGGTLPARLV